MRKILASIFATLLLSTPAMANPVAAAFCDFLAGHPYEPGHNGRGVEWGAVFAPPAIYACREALKTTPDAPEILFRLARTLMQVGEYKEALPMMLRAAEMGYAPAEAAYGSAYQQAQGVSPDYHIALEWLSRAAAQDHIIGLNNLGALYDRGWGEIAPDHAKARELYQRAADLGYVHAIYNLGLSYERAEGGEQDYDKSFQLFSQAASMGHVSAAQSLGRAYDRGRGTPVDPVQSVLWYGYAAQAGLPGAQYQLALAYANGKGVEKNDQLAEAWLRHAMASGFTPAHRALAFMLMTSGEKPSRAPEAIAIYEAAAELGDMEAYLQLAEYYVQIRNYERGRDYASFASDHGDQAAKTRADMLLRLVETYEARFPSRNPNRRRMPPHPE